MAESHTAYKVLRMCFVLRVLQAPYAKHTKACQRQSEQSKLWLAEKSHF